MKDLLKREWVQNLLAFLASLYVRFVFITSCWTQKNFAVPSDYLEKNRPFITCFWHSRLLLFPYGWPGGKNTFFMLISAHKDGRLISKAAQYFGINTISGSTKKRGVEALLGMVRLSRQGKTIGITPDGPRGPSFQISDGTLMTSYLAKADLIPFTYSVKRHKSLQTWDHFLLPMPFSKGSLIWGDPVPYPRTKGEFSAVKEQLKKSLDLLNIQADQQVKN